MTGTEKNRTANNVDVCLRQWALKELQLVRLHEELVAKREALLGCSSTYHHSQELRVKLEASNSHSQEIGMRTEASNLQQAVSRNQKLMQDIATAQSYALEALNLAPSPRFMTLQKNYWSMVKSQVPMWEQDIGISRTNVVRKKEGRIKTPRQQVNHFSIKSPILTGSQKNTNFLGQYSNRSSSVQPKKKVLKKHQKKL